MSSMVKLLSRGKIEKDKPNNYRWRVIGRRSERKPGLEKRGSLPSA